MKKVVCDYCGAEDDTYGQGGVISLPAPDDREINVTITATAGERYVTQYGSSGETSSHRPVEGFLVCQECLKSLILKELA